MNNNKITWKLKWTIRKPLNFCRSFESLKVVSLITWKFGTAVQWAGKCWSLKCVSGSKRIQPGLRSQYCFWTERGHWAFNSAIFSRTGQIQHRLSARCPSTTQETSSSESETLTSQLQQVWIWNYSWLDSGLKDVRGHTLTTLGQLVMCRSILEQDSEPQAALDGQAGALQLAAVDMCECEYEWVNERQTL